MTPFSTPAPPTETEEPGLSLGKCCGFPPLKGKPLFVYVLSVVGIKFAKPRCLGMVFSLPARCVAALVCFNARAPQQVLSVRGT